MNNAFNKAKAKNFPQKGHLKYQKHMPDHHATTTAFSTLFIRGVHQLLDAHPLILDDPVALQLLGDPVIRKILENAGHHRTPEATALRSHIVLRSRFAEDCLHAAAQRGVAQYVILGAGFDTFAFRQPAWARTLNIIEVDQLKSQALKIAQIQKAGLFIPANLKFVGVDFECESLHSGLLRQDVSLTVPTFFSWLGVTMYLRESAMDAVLETIAGFPAQSEVVFTFTHPKEMHDDREAHFHSSLSRAVSGRGEPFVSYFAPSQIEAKLKRAGFRSVFFLSGEEAENKYFLNRPRDLYVSKRSSIVRASV